MTVGGVCSGGGGFELVAIEEAQKMTARSTQLKKTI